MDLSTVGSGADNPMQYIIIAIAVAVVGGFVLRMWNARNESSPPVANGTDTAAPVAGPPQSDSTAVQAGGRSLNDKVATEFDLSQLKQ